MTTKTKPSGPSHSQVLATGQGLLGEQRWMALEAALYKGSDLTPRDHLTRSMLREESPVFEKALTDHTLARKESADA